MFRLLKFSTFHYHFVFIFGFVFKFLEAHIYDHNHWAASLEFSWSGVQLERGNIELLWLRRWVLEWHQTSISSSPRTSVAKQSNIMPPWTSFSAVLKFWSLKSPDITLLVSRCMMISRGRFPAKNARKHFWKFFWKKSWNYQNSSNKM